MNGLSGKPSPRIVRVDGSSVAVWQFGSPTGWPLVWHHGGLICGLDARVLDGAARRCGAAIYSIDRPGIGHSDWRDTPTMAHWPQTVAHVADVLRLRDFAAAGWSGGGAGVRGGDGRASAGRRDGCRRGTAQ
jgi:pimeloyl-ACP methyl ester carboxylesterase